MTKKGKKTPEKSVITRPPIVTVVGHIDHGKTTLLDKIRQSRVAHREEGGITQHINAYKIKNLNQSSNKNKINSITFIDTPGHAAFTKMRARGVDITDLVILVVAADSGVQEQTQESYKHIKAADVPFLVAINKIDLPEANVDKAKGQLSEIGIIPEDYGGDIVTVPVSAQTGEGIEELLEMILLLAEMEELKAEPDGELEGVVIESKLDKQKGPLATVLVKNGTLRKGEQIFAEKIPAKVKDLVNWQGKKIEKVLPGDPAEVLGFKDAPPIGAVISRQPQEPQKIKVDEEKEDGKLKIVLKSDVKGCSEAILSNLPDEVQVVHCGVGDVTQNDVFLAQSMGAELFAFRVKLMPAAKALAKQRGVKIFQTKVIYELFEEIERRLEEEKDPLENKIILGRAKVLAEFRVADKEIAGGEVKEGDIVRGKKVFLMRNDKLVDKSVLASLRHGNEDIKKAEKDQEFGAVFSPPLDFKKGDVIISYKDEQSDKTEE